VPGKIIQLAKPWFNGGYMQAILRSDIFLDSQNFLADAKAIPFKFDSLRIEVGQRPIGFRFSQHIVNIIAQLGHSKIAACGEADSRELAEAKALSELMERSALVSFGHKYGAKNSNGWAAHPNKVQCRANAIFELIERDAVLAHWYSAAPFSELAQDQWPLEIQHWATTELSRSEFPRIRILVSNLGIGPSVTCVFQNGNGFGVCAHSSRPTLTEAIKSAIAEACRPAHASIRRDHWADSLKLKVGNGDPSAHEAHGVFYAYHEPFPKWMFGESMNWDQALNLWSKKSAAMNADDTQFKFEVVSEAPLFVGFATHHQAFELRWGSTDVDWISSLSGYKRIGLNKNQINKEVHIVS